MPSYCDDKKVTCSPCDSKKIIFFALLQSNDATIVRLLSVEAHDRCDSDADVRSWNSDENNKISYKFAVQRIIWV